MLWGAPDTVESFLQRIGRGNRRTQKTNAIACVSEAQLITEALKFLALIEAGRSGQLHDTAPYDLFGAIAQQVLSIVGSKGAHYTRIADLVAITDHLPYTNRDLVEKIVLGLVESDHLVAHPYRNQVGPGPALYNLIDDRLIYGNFPLGSSEVPIIHGSQTLGTIPAINIRTVKPHDSIRFAHRSWTVQAANRDGIRVIANKNTPPSKQLRFGSSKGHMDTFLVDYIGQVVYASDNTFAPLANSLRSQVLDALVSLRSKTTRADIPYVHLGDMHGYVTFAGVRVNQALALSVGDIAVEVNDYGLITPAPIVWSDISTTPRSYSPERLDPQGESSIFQELLPVDFKVKESCESWLKDSSVLQVLQRLAGAHTVKVDRNDVQMFL